MGDDGEIQVKTPGKMIGYYKNPEATAETLTEDGYVRTGDKGMMEDHKGVQLLKITGRTKEIFKTSKGKYVAPAPIENILVGHNLVELAVVTGASYPQPFALVQLSEFAKKKALANQADYAAQLEAHVKTAVNATVEAHEKLSCLVIIGDDWLPENGFLTPTQKIKRTVIEEAYGKYFDEWTSSKQPVVWFGFEETGKAEEEKPMTNESEQEIDV